MEPHVIFDAEFTGLHYRKGKGVTDSQHTGSGNTRRDTERARLADMSHAQRNVTVFAKSRIAFSGYCNQSNPQLLDHIYQAGDFVCFAAVA